MGPENEIKSAGVDYVRKRGYVARILSGPARVLKQLAGLPDVFVFGPDFLWMWETKTKAGRLEGSQLKFYESVKPFLGAHLRYSVPRSVQEIIIEAAQLPPAF